MIDIGGARLRAVFRLCMFVFPVLVLRDLSVSALACNTWRKLLKQGRNTVVMSKLVQLLSLLLSIF